MNTELHAAETLLDKGIKVPARAPLFFRLFGKRQISLVIRQPYLGTLYRISHLFLKAGMDEVLQGTDEISAQRLFNQYSKPMAAIAAQAWLNGYWMGKIFGGLVARSFLNMITPLHLLYIIKALAALTGTDAFTNSIESVRNLKTTSPRTSQEAQGS